ncbi:MAG: hypothetical protein LBJ63_11400 [Prevotellaceae bacterium]|jgi:hypothetical protein|nr:hypothetical protein [Prevotellaceae bacterium]
MKKLIYSISFALLVVACGKDDVDINTNPKAIVGNWKSTYLYADDKSSEIDFTKYNTYYYQEHPDRPAYVTFLADTACGMIYWDDDTKKNIYSYEIDGDKIKKSGNCEINDDNMLLRAEKWSIVNNKLIIAYKDWNLTVYLVFDKL